MTWTAFMQVPWVHQLRTIHCIPRALADDIHIIAQGQFHEERFRAGYEATLRYMQALGLKVSHKKCFLFSTVPETRPKLANHVWITLHKPIPVVLHFRDLVAHASAGIRLFGGTLNDRLAAATAFANKLEHVSWDYDTKQSVVRTLVLTTGLYGCEVTPYSITAMGLLYTAVAKAIGPYNHCSSNPMAFNTAAPTNLDPVAEVLVRRVMGLRRNLAKHPHLRTLVDSIYACYLHRGSYGTQVDPKLLGALAPAPPPNYQAYSSWNCPAGPACGPIGLLLHQLRDTCMGMNASLVIFDGNWSQLDLLKAPFQHVKPWLHQASCNTRSVLAASSRTDLKDMPSLDYLAYSTIMKRMPAERRDRIKLIHCCGGASPVKLHQLATHIEEK